MIIRKFRILRFLASFALTTTFFVYSLLLVQVHMPDAFWSYWHGQVEELQTDWQQVQNASHRFHVYSAFYDDRSQIIRVISVSRIRKPDEPICRFHYSGNYPRVNGQNKNSFRHSLVLRHSVD